VDLLLLLEDGLEALTVRGALVATFATRATHELPAVLPPPPDSWQQDFAALAAEARLETTDFHDAFAILQAFWNEGALGMPEAGG
jgi:hypothetical protein